MSWHGSLMTFAGLYMKTFPRAYWESVLSPLIRIHKERGWGGTADLDKTLLSDYQPAFHVIRDTVVVRPRWCYDKKAVLCGIGSYAYQCWLMFADEDELNRSKSRDKRGLLRLVPQVVSPCIRGSGQCGVGQRPVVQATDIVILILIVIIPVPCEVCHFTVVISRGRRSSHMKRYYYFNCAYFVISVEFLNWNKCAFVCVCILSVGQMQW